MKNLNRIVSSENDILMRSLLNSLGPLPSIVRYYDDFDGKVRTIDNFDVEDVFDVYIAGSVVSLNFIRLGSSFGCLAKHLFFLLITEDLRLSTAYGYISALNHVGTDLIAKILDAGPQRIKQVWPLLFAAKLDFMPMRAIKWLLILLSQRYLFGWSPLYLDFISFTLPLPTADKYSTIRTGEAFLSLREEAGIVSYLDEIVTELKNVSDSTDHELYRDAGMLMFVYLFGMRPYQIAQVAMRDVRIWTGSDGTISVHITFQMIKQRRKSSAFMLVRRIRHSWAPLIAFIHAAALGFGYSASDRLFGINSSQEVGRKIRQLATRIVGSDITGTDLRHTGAQRLVDAGASQEEVAAYLGHSDITTSLIYFQSSPSQAERVNQALAISPIYQHIVTIAHARFISPETLAQLKDEQQVGGVPHGIPISGIGGCATGQPTCPYNPVTSCYGCRNFMPVVDIPLHKRVLEDLRGVVLFFVDSSRNDSDSPAFQQLRLTLIAIQNVIEQLEADNGSA